MRKKTTSFNISDTDEERLLEICGRFGVNRSRVLSMGINLFYAIIYKGYGDDKPEKKCYKEVVLPNWVEPDRKQEATPAPPCEEAVVKKRGWPKGKKRGPRKAAAPLLRVVK